jgi:DNA-binding PadR family transcriptional regulator
MGNTLLGISETVSQELRRGSVILAVLSQLKEEQYGYSLRNLLAEKGMRIDEGTLYPLLRRLESQGLLQSSWKIEDSRPRRYYRLNSTGESALRGLQQVWNDLVQVMEGLLS